MAKKDYSEDLLIQAPTAEFLEKQLGWTSLFAQGEEDFGPASLLGRKDEVVSGEKKPSLVIIGTDGDNNEPGDKERTMRVLRESEARRDQVYFLFLGISNQGSTFPFLETLGDKFGNTGFVPIPNLRQFNALGDEALNDYLIKDELRDWLASLK